jgi:hypothetical protein
MALRPTADVAESGAEGRVAGDDDRSIGAAR